MANNSALGLGLTEAIATYMRAKFLCKLQNSNVPIPFPSEWDFTLLQECDHAVSILVEAHNNACKLSALGDRPRSP